MTRRLLLAATGMFVLEAPALLVGGLWPLVVVMFVAGWATAPMLITSLSLAQRLVPAALVTEGMAVAITGILIGISGGSAVGGWAIEAWGAQQAYAVPVLAGALALAIIARATATSSGHERAQRLHSGQPGAGAHHRLRRAGRRRGAPGRPGDRLERSDVGQSQDARRGRGRGLDGGREGNPGDGTAYRTARSIVRVLPAMAPFETSRATPSRTSTAAGPST